MNQIRNGWFSEINDQWPGQALSLEVEEILYTGRSKHQDILVFKRYVNTFSSKEAIITILMYLIYHVKQNPDWQAPTLCNLTPLNKTLSVVCLTMTEYLTYNDENLWRHFNLR